MALKAAFFDAVRSTLSDGALSQHQVDVFNAISAAWDKHGDKFGYADMRLSYVLATAWHETGRFKWLKEIWGPTAAQKRYEGRADLGNTVAGDGFKFLGRGLAHITGRRNYTDWSRRLGIDLVKEPQLAEELPIAARILVEGMVKGTFTGKKLQDYINSDQCDYVEARRIVNGKDEAALIAGYAEKFEAALIGGRSGAPAPSPAPKSSRPPAGGSGKSPAAVLVAVLLAIAGGFYAFLKNQGILL
jgi:predicted chitinase